MEIPGYSHQTTTPALKLASRTSPMRFSLRKAVSAVANPKQAPVTRDDVVSAYRLILGREPEDESVVRSATQCYKNIEQLRQGFLHSEEFAAANAPLILARRFPHDLDEGSQPIEVHCEGQALSELLAHVETTWRRLGEEDPYWSVITTDDYRIVNFETNQEAFWNSGKIEVIRLQRWMKRNEIKLPVNSTCLEYGCGTGRMTRWLSREFGTVVACDISEAHLQIARQAIPEEVSRRVTFLRVDGPNALDDLPAFDLLFSVLVLQHNPPPVIAYILDKLLARLSLQGFACFQVPTFQPGYRFVLAEYLAAASKGSTGMEMHVLPQRYIFDIAARNGCELIEVSPDNLTSSLDYVSTTFLLRKAG